MSIKNFLFILTGFILSITFGLKTFSLTTGAPHFYTKNEQTPWRHFKPINSVFFTAIAEGNIKVVEEFIEKNGCINNENINKEQTEQTGEDLVDHIDHNSPLHYAIYYKQTEVAELLIKKGADVNIRNRVKKTPLFYVKQLKDVKLLIENGADPNARDRVGLTFLHRIEGYIKPIDVVEIAKYLIQNGADVTIKPTGEFGETSLESARGSFYPNKEFIEVLEKAEKEQTAAKARISR